MTLIKHESGNMMVSKKQIDSPSIVEGSSGGPGGEIFKKGPWTSAEDAILVEYVKKHGEGNWNAVQKHSGLSRCGKSCRLRWANHLRPNLKKGAMTPEEEQLIIELHARMGNKWARMAAHLPGRTDNEIKNYWNTRIKRCQRTGLPLYPSGTGRCFDASENLQSWDANEQQSEVLQESTCGIIPNVIFDKSKADQGALSYASLFPDISWSAMLTQGFGSNSFGYRNPTGNHLKRPRESESFVPEFYDSLRGGPPTLQQFSSWPDEPIHRSFAIPGSHAISNGNLSTSRPLPGTVKLELPSLQSPETDLSSWLACPSSPSVEAVDAYIQSPPRNSGLLEALLLGPRALGSMKNQQSEKCSNSSVFTPSDMVESSTLGLGESDWGDYKEPISLLGLSSKFISANAEHVSTPSVGELDGHDPPDFTRPDALLGSDLLDESSRGAKEHWMLNDAIATLLNESLFSEHNHMPSGTASGLESYSWNTMPRVYQMSENP